MGFNVSTKQVEDLVAAGVIDSAKMLRIVLEVAFAHAKLVLQTDDWELDPTPRAQSD
jgi:chaperonin GroEL (HSP60 family)